MTPSSSDLWPRLAELPLVVEGCELERLQADPSSGVDRVTTQIRLLGAGTDGLGEDVSPYADDEHDALHVGGPSLPLAGEWTLQSFCDHLATLEQWSTPPLWETARLYRSWAYESAALDLALRQAGRALHEALDLDPRPMRFVNSLGLGDPPSTRAIRDRLARYPGLGFKLDVEPAWTVHLMTELAASERVESIDFKGHYGFEVKDVEALAALYDRVLLAFPGAVLEDPHDLPEITAWLTPHVGRVAYDAPIHSAADLDATPLAARWINVKPSRVGSLNRCSISTPTAPNAACGCTAVAWVRWASAAARFSCSLRSFTPTRPTTSLRSATTQPTRPTACRPARYVHDRRPTDSAGRPPDCHPAAT